MNLFFQMSFSKPSKFKTEDVFSTYKSAYKLKIPWNEVLAPELFEFLTLYQKAYNCPLDLAMGSMLPLAAAMCGPDSKVESHDASFSSTLNCYLIAVCDPGGGKSNTFTRISEPVLQNYREKMGHSLELETYTTAGLHKHQQDSKGYGLLTSDEGHRLLGQLRCKQAKGDSEVAFLCKMWGGKGDSSALSGGVRGFEKTSMSICAFIQPEPLMAELQHFHAADGFVDRFLFISAKPYLSTSAIKREALVALQDQRMSDFTDVFQNIHNNHKGGKVYRLSEEAQVLFDEMSDAFVEYINSKYNSDSGE